MWCTNRACLLLGNVGLCSFGLQTQLSVSAQVQSQCDLHVLPDLVLTEGDFLHTEDCLDGQLRKCTLQAQQVGDRSLSESYL